MGEDVVVSVGGGFTKFVDHVERFGEDEEKKWQAMMAPQASKAPRRRSEEPPAQGALPGT